MKKVFVLFWVGDVWMILSFVLDFFMSLLFLFNVCEICAWCARRFSDLLLWWSVFIVKKRWFGMLTILFMVFLWGFGFEIVTGFDGLFGCFVLVLCGWTTLMFTFFRCCGVDLSDLVSVVSSGVLVLMSILSWNIFTRITSLKFCNGLASCCFPILSSEGSGLYFFNVFFLCTLCVRKFLMKFTWFHNFFIKLGGSFYMVFLFIFGMVMSCVGIMYKICDDGFRSVRIKLEFGEVVVV